MPSGTLNRGCTYNTGSTAPCSTFADWQPRQRLWERLSWKYCLLATVPSWRIGSLTSKSSSPSLQKTPASSVLPSASARQRSCFSQHLPQLSTDLPFQLMAPSWRQSTTSNTSTAWSAVTGVWTRRSTPGSARPVKLLAAWRFACWTSTASGSAQSLRNTGWSYSPASSMVVRHWPRTGDTWNSRSASIWAACGPSWTSNGRTLFQTYRSSKWPSQPASKPWSSKVNIDNRLPKQLSIIYPLVSNMKSPKQWSKNKTLPKYVLEMCQIMKIGQIVVSCDLSDSRLTEHVRRPSPSSNKYLNLVSVCSKWCGRNHQAYFKLCLGDYVTKQ